ncbi:MAG: hypothetical protein AB1Z55_04280 [Acidimicrobiia bacterium]
MRRCLLVIMVVTVVVAGCGGGSSDTTAAGDTTTSVATSTTEATTTSTEAATTTTMATTTTVDTNTLAEGSGCTPGTPDDLPDGTWFGYAVSATDTTMDFDLACWFSGDAAVLAAAEDGAESPPPNDYHIRNENPALRTLTVAPSTEVESFATSGDPSTVETVTWADWAADRAGPLFEVDGVDVYQDIWITVTGGEVVAVEEQYRP